MHQRYNEEDNSLIKSFKYDVLLIQATIDDYPLIQNMGQFYQYDMSKNCNWALPADGLYKCSDFKDYFEDSTKKAFLIKVGSEIAGFILLNQIGVDPKANWNMGEFFILGKFQGKGIGENVAHQIWKMFPGAWEVAVMPENKAALAFWSKIIASYTDSTYSQKVKERKCNEYNFNLVIFTFTSKR